MEIRRLEVFCKVIELKSFTRAADAVLLSQPSVSEHVRLLEEHFGDKLLDRLGREVLPTPAGKILYQYGRRIIQLRDEAIQSIDHFKGHLGGDLAVGASTIPGCYILPEIIVGFHGKHPGIHIMLKISGTSQALQRLVEGDIETAIVGAKPADKRLECKEAFEDELVLAVPNDHPWARREDVELSQLVGEPFIQRERGSGTRSVMNETLADCGLDEDRLSVVAEMGSTEAV
ncbi:MAG: LysR family transcriptional regulator, partial [Desulfuromonadales bacterium]|nr:LysR family transcriptional regulator [Desulfuromonadales bacterium]NIS39785.1 LysR family transcriptional regulator [Desulfuromonadales bacterium]